MEANAAARSTTTAADDSAPSRAPKRRGRVRNDVLRPVVLPSVLPSVQPAVQPAVAGLSTPDPQAPDPEPPPLSTSDLSAPERAQATLAPVDARNDVCLVGRLSAGPQVRELPSGDSVVSWRLVVDRPPPERRLAEGARPPTVDVLDCAAWTGPTQRAAMQLAAGDVVEVRGALRRRFWRTGAGAQSRYEVEVRALCRPDAAAADPDGVG